MLHIDTIPVIERLPLSISEPTVSDPAVSVVNVPAAPQIALVLMLEIDAVVATPRVFVLILPLLEK